MAISALKDLWAVRNILIVLLSPVILLPLPLIVDTREAEGAYVVIIMAVYWITEALPIAVTSLLPIILFPMVGIMNAKDVSSAYVNDTSMLFLGGLIVAAAIEHWNIHKRISLGILRIVGSEPHWLMLGMMLPTWFLSMWISNTATTAMMIPIANAVLMQLNTTKTSDDTRSGTGEPAVKAVVWLNVPVIIVTVRMVRICSSSVDNPVYDIEDIKVTNQAYEEPKHGNGQLEPTERKDKESDGDASSNISDVHHLRMCKTLSLAIAYSANIGGIASLTGTGPNVVMKGQSDIVFENHGGESPVTFASWMQFGLPLSAIMVVILWLWLQIYFLRCRPCFSCCKKEDKEVSRRISEVIKSEYDKLGPITFGQGAIIGHFIVLAVLWICRDLGGVGGWGDIFPKKTVSDSTPAILISASLFLFPSSLPRIFCCSKDGKRSFEPLLPWNVAEKKVPWGVILLLGGGFALAKGCEDSGLSSWLGDQLTVFSSLEPWVMNLILCYIVAAATEVTSNTAICTLMMPIMAELALKLHVNPLYYMFPTAIATSFAFMLPVATPPNAVVFSYGHVRVIDMVTAGFMMNILAVLVLVGATESWGNSIFNFHTQPSIFHNSTFNGSLTLAL